ncbi:hypothetical protein G6F22_014308 [Rhizopus arrhizus]|nr:hypothetical protein G6F22_014308 [Rhizopus arrhizus]
MPGRLAGSHIDGYQRGRVAVLVFRARATPVVAGRIAQRQVDQPQCLVTGGRGPHVRRTTRIGLFARRQAATLGLVHVPRPAQLAGDRVVGLDHPRRCIATLPVQHLVAGDDHPAHDGRRRSDRHVPRRYLAHAQGDVDLAVVAEVGAGPAAAGIHRDEAAVQRAFDDARPAGRMAARRSTPGHAGRWLRQCQIGSDIRQCRISQGRCARLLVVTHTATGGGVRDRGILHFGIEPPQLPAAGGIKRDQPVAGGAQASCSVPTLAGVICCSGE